jgi:chromatin assembly factor 1 subunit B
MVHPNILPPSLAETAEVAVSRPPRVEYLATLSRHSAAVNVVRFSPNGTYLLSVQHFLNHRPFLCVFVFIAHM